MTALDPEAIYGKPFPELRSERLRLRELADGDGDGLYALFADARVTRWYDLETFTDPAQGAQLRDRWRQRWERRIGMRWVLCPPETPDRVLGTCGFNLWWPDAARAVLGFDLAPAHWGRGLMREALSTILDFGFSQLQLNRVEALVFDGNDASCGLLQRLGFQREGVLREYQRLHGTLADMHLYALLRREHAAPAAGAPR